MAQLASQQTAKTKVEVGIARRSQVLPCNLSYTRPHGLSNGRSELVPAGGTLPCRERLSSKHACRPQSRLLVGPTKELRTRPNRAFRRSSEKHNIRHGQIHRSYVALNQPPRKRKLLANKHSLFQRKERKIKKGGGG